MDDIRFADTRDDAGARARHWQARLATTLATWLVAFLIVMTLLSVFGHQLAALPGPLRALVLSGVLVILMVNVVMPVLNRVIGARLSR